ncbi:MAG: hypothetical protein AAF585_26765, partial [Verrucomicrobiota bacterium]
MQEAASSEGNLDEAVAFRNEINRIAADEPIPAEQKIPAQLKELQETHREQTGKIMEARSLGTKPIVRKFDAALAELQEQLTKANELDAALAVRAYRQSRLSDKLSENCEPPPVRIDREEALRELLDWAWSAKYGIEISIDGERVIKRVGDPMPNDFELIRIFSDVGRSIEKPKPFPWHALPGIPEIEELQMIRTGASIQAAHLEALATLEKLEALVLERSKFDPNSFDGMPKLANLKQFDTRFTAGFQGAWIRKLHNRCPNLEAMFLSFGGTDQVWSKEHFAALTKFEKLQRLELQGPGKLDNAFASNLQQLPELDVLSIVGVNWTADSAAVAKLAECPKLRGFHTRSNSMLPQLPEILALPNLDEVSLKYASPSDADLRVIAENASRRLKVLRIENNTTVTDAGIAQLGSMKHLRELHLR